MPDLYSTPRIPFLLAQWLRSHRFSAGAVAIGKTLRELNDLDARQAQLEERREFLLRTQLPMQVADADATRMTQEK